MATKKFYTGQKGPQAVNALNELWDHSSEVSADAAAAVGQAQAIKNDLQANWGDKLAAATAKAAESTASASASEASRLASGVSAGIAGQKATDATTNGATQVALAAAQVSLATAAKVAAEAARDALNTTGKVFTFIEGTAAGLAATTNGQQFAVLAADLFSWGIYRNNAGVALFLSSTYTKAYLDSALDFKQKTISDTLQIADVDGNLVVRLAAGVTLDMKAPFATEAEGGIRTSGFGISKKVLRWKEVHTDDDGNVLYGVDELGRLVANFALAPIPSKYKTGGTYAYGVNHIFNYGQSLSVGQATPVLSTIQSYDNLMFARGMIPQYSYTGEAEAQWYASLVPAVEAQSPTQPTLAETPCMGTGDAIKQLILQEDGLTHGSMQYQLMLSAPGYGATTIAQLSKGAGTGHYERMIAQASYAMALANLAGKTYCVLAVTWTQGESDYLAGTTRAAYATKLNQLVADFNADFKAITGQAEDIPLIAYQLASHKVNGSAVPTIALALLDVEESNPLVYISTPMYQMNYQSSSNNHLDNVSSRWLGGYHGHAIKRICIDKVNWKPVKPISYIRQGKTLVIKFNVPYGRLVLDAALCPLIANFGFELFDAVGVAMTITSVVVSGPDTVAINAASNIPASADIHYGWTGADNVGPTGPRGNLRDTEGLSFIFDPLGINKPSHNTCVIFNKVLP